MPRFEGVWMYHPGFDAVHYVPGSPGVIKSFEARDWQQTDLPANLDDDDPEFIEALEALRAENTEEDAEPVEAEQPAVEEEGSE